MTPLHREQDTSAPEHSLSPGNLQIMSNGPCCLCLCVVASSMPHWTPAEHIITEVRKDQTLPFVRSYTSSDLNKQRDPGFSCSIVLRMEQLAFQLCSPLYLSSPSAWLCTSNMSLSHCLFFCKQSTAPCKYHI